MSRYPFDITPKVTDKIINLANNSKKTNDSETTIMTIANHHNTNTEIPSVILRTLDIEGSTLESG